MFKKSYSGDLLYIFSVPTMSLAEMDYFYNLMFWKFSALLISVLETDRPDPELNRAEIKYVPAQMWVQYSSELFSTYKNSLNGPTPSVWFLFQSWWEAWAPGWVFVLGRLFPLDGWSPPIRKGTLQDQGMEYLEDDVSYQPECVLNLILGEEFGKTVLY